MQIPSSNLFTGLSWDLEMTQMPTLNGTWRLLDGRKIEVAMIGENEMPWSWEEFVRLSEESCQLLVQHEDNILGYAHPTILSLLKGHFKNRWKKGHVKLLREMTWREIGFYSNGATHLGYQCFDGSDQLDFDIVLDADLRTTQVNLFL